MRRFLIMLLINVGFFYILLVTSDLLNHGPTMFPDSASYIDLGDDMKRTVGYPLLLNLFQLAKGWYVILCLFNCAVGAFMFYVVYELIGKKAWILAILGAFTVYVPAVLTDLLFATLFVTAIWQLKKKHFWVFLPLIAVASIIRPSLAWFFLIIPAVMYFYQYRGKILYIALPVVFLATSFSPIRNYINHQEFTHSNIFKHNMTSEKYFGGRESIPAYFYSAFKNNCLSDHYKYIGNVYGVFKDDTPGREESTVMEVVYWIGVIAMCVIWLRFGLMFLAGRINLGDALIAAYMIIPALFGSAGARMRLPIEWILLM